MTKLDKEFFKGNEVLFVGYSSKDQVFSKMVYDAFSKNGIKVYPVNTKEGGSYDVKVFKSLAELPKVPETAYMLLNSANAMNVIKELSAKGVKRMLFQNRKVANAAVLEACKSNGIETVVACPMMKFGTGIHKIHAFFAGIR